MLNKQGALNFSSVWNLASCLPIITIFSSPFFAWQRITFLMYEVASLSVYVGVCQCVNMLRVCQVVCVSVCQYAACLSVGVEADLQLFMSVKQSSAKTEKKKNSCAIR